MLRGLGGKVPFLVKEYERLCKGNKYATTLHIINSAIVKLSKTMPVETVRHALRTRPFTPPS